MIGKYSHIRAAAVLLLSVVSMGCSSQRSAPSAPDPSTTLQSIPAADSAQVDRIRDMKTWRNPYLIVRTDGVALLDAADNAEIRLKTAELLPALAALPASDWPYGRVVAAAQIGTQLSEQDGVAVRRNKGIVGGILQGAHIAIKWVPSA